ncbi:MAG: DsbA family oxidoreductase, partial [Nitrospiraceae bacterium]
MNEQNNPETGRLATAALRVDIFSDVICPWCFIGKRRLEKALNAWNGRSEHRITWRPFQLNPAIPRAGTDRAAYLDAKFGGSEARRAQEARVAAVGRSEGIPFAFERIQRTPNTFDAHRLIWLGQNNDRQDEVVEGLFRGYFEDG